MSTNGSEGQAAGLGADAGSDSGTAYEVQQGDCVGSIAYEHGFFWQTLWNLAENAQLKQTRKDPNVLYPGDLLTVPALRLKEEPGATEARHMFCLKGVPEVFRLRLLNAWGKPRANIEYVLWIEGVSWRGTTDADGELQHPIPPNAREGRLIIGQGEGREEIALALGHLDPVAEITGVQMRLQNLGFGCGEPDGKSDAEMSSALAHFQRSAGLQASGKLDDATRQELQQRHGC